MMRTTTPKADSIDLAKFILAKLGDMTHLKLQKLLYYVEAWHLACFGESITADDFKAWVHGPVSTRVWNVFKNASSPLLSDLRISTGEAKAVVGRISRLLRPEQLSLIEDVLREYGKLNAYELEGLTHSEKPWIEARRGVASDEPSSRPISKSTMTKFYRARLGKGHEQVR
ncbi:MAG: Panacea domain-containing protein [Limisphaerales bacterium]